ncbi:MAG: metallopeptidase [Candidatus Diapherotrites archaeon]|uniref:Metallopeptidase n=1 Tax=Candidatus Iainarchaeum sp. TaxID=3101447 RepID=A0A8T3YK06_9ARCH|nr:metallopeptidase [Candidatus Diapherotrites archaeon]
MKYAFDSAWTEKAHEMARTLGYGHVMQERLSVVRSWGSKTRRTIARIHCIGKVMMLGMGQKKSFYVIELISEKFDRQPEREKLETIIHELMHIPRTFGGGFRHHDHVCSRNVKTELERYLNMQK